MERGEEHSDAAARGFLGEADARALDVVPPDPAGQPQGDRLDPGARAPFVAMVGVALSEAMSRAMTLAFAIALAVPCCKKPISRADVGRPGVDAKLSADLVAGHEYAFVESFDYESTPTEDRRVCYRWAVRVDLAGAAPTNLVCNPFLYPTLETGSHRAATDARVLDCTFEASRTGPATVTVQLVEQPSCGAPREVTFAGPPKFKSLSLALAR